MLEETISELVKPRGLVDPLKGSNFELPTVDHGTNMYSFSNERLFYLKQPLLQCSQRRR